MASSILLGWERNHAPPTGIGFMRPDHGHEPRKKRRRGGPVADHGEGHAIVVAPTGTGKGRAVAVPQLLTWPGSCVVLDIKGELAETTAEFRRKHLGHRIVRLDPWKQTTDRPNRLDPLDALRQPGASVPDRAYRLASMLSDPRTLSHDPYWSERGQSLIAGLAALRASLATSVSERGLAQIWRDVHADDTVFHIATLLDRHKDAVPDFARGLLAGFLQTADTTRSCIASVAESQIRIFATDEVRDATSETDFDLGALTRGEKVTVYLIVPWNCLVTNAALVRLWLSVILGAITERRSRPSSSTLLLLDEVAQLGPMAEIRTIMTLARGYGVRAMLLVQTLDQLRECYRDATTLIDNAGVLMTFGHNSMPMSRDMAQLFGDVHAEDLHGMPSDTLAVKRPGRDTEFLRKCDYVTDTMFRTRAAPNPMFRRKPPGGRT